MPLRPKTESARLQDAAAHGLARAEAAMPAGDLDLWPTSWQAQKIAKVAAMTAGYVRSCLRGSLECQGVRTTIKFGNNETRRREPYGLVLAAESAFDCMQIETKYSD